MRTLKKFFKVTPFKVSTFIAIVFCAITMVYHLAPTALGPLTPLLDKTVDLKFMVRGIEPAKAKIVIVAGDEKSFQKFGQWPFDRGTVFTPLLDKICSFNVKALGIDLVWTDQEKLIAPRVKNSLFNALGSRATELEEAIQSASGDAAMKGALSRCGNKVVMGYALFKDERNGATGEEFNNRLKLVTTGSGKNNLLVRQRGQLKFPRYGREYTDPEATVLFDSVATSGQLNVAGMVPQGVAQGFFNNDMDSDGNYRKGLLFFRAGDTFVSSLALRMAQKVMSPDDTQPLLNISAETKNSAYDLRLEMPTANGMVQLPIDHFGNVLVNYRGPNFTYANVSMADVVDSSESIEYVQVTPEGDRKIQKTHKTEFFKDALVLIGMTAVSIYDIRPRPFDPVAAGVENHASILDNLINNDFLIKPSAESLITMLISLFVLSIMFGFAVAKLDAKLSALFGATIIAGTLYFDQVVLFNNKRIVFAGLLQASQFLAQYLAITVLRYMQEESEKKFIRSAFDKYVSPEVINQMLADPAKLMIGGDKKELTILFSDIRGFTELSERLDVKALATFLNEYLGAMTDILQNNGGTLDKYIGDAVMGFWGAPLDNAEHARLAVKTAVEMVARLDELNVEFQKKYGLTIDIGIGINTGPVTVGNFGSSKVFSYTVIGDNVNLASRLEGVNKYYGTHIIVSESTYAMLKQGEFLSREVDTVKVKGKHKPVKIYEIFPDNKAHEPLKGVLGQFNEGLKQYYGRHWEKAMVTFETVLKSRDKDKPSLEMIERCKYYLSNPPAQDWDGSWEMHSK